MPSLAHLDHIVCLYPDIEVNAREMQALLGWLPTWRSTTAGGAWISEYRMPKGAIEMIAPADEVVTSKSLQAKLDRTGPQGPRGPHSRL